MLTKETRSTIPNDQAEALRLEALRNYGILDTPPEERFDRLTRLVSRELKVPISLVSLVDHQRQWFKSSVGLNARETPRDIAFCHHAIQSNEILVVPDATKDIRFAENPLVTSDPSIRFYAGAPLKTAGGHRLGTLCAIDSSPRELTPRQAELLSEVSAIAVDELELSLALGLRETQARQLSELNDALERSNLYLKRFAFVASHDLQEPLRMITAYCDLLSRRCADKLDGEAIEFLGFVTDGATRMREMIDGLLAYASATRECQNDAMVDTENVIDSVLKDLSVAIEERGAQVTHDPLPRVAADRSQVRQLFANLLSNALKFCTHEPRIHIGLEKLDARWRFSVSDNGIGIASDQVSKVFEPFERLHTKAEYPGSGIGLAVCRSIVEGHGGTLDVASAPGGGSTFEFTLPSASKQLAA